MPTLNAQHGALMSQTREHILLRKPFTTNGALSGVALSSGVYLVYSYAEPIARFLPGLGWEISTLRFSATTSRHQSTVRQALRSIPDTDRITTEERIHA